jgi:peptidoglycan/xylan/chitin deacetylase (PgdA/CDA1 family)
MTARGSLVLLYHRVARLHADPHGLAVSPDLFAEHCAIVRRRCDVVALGAADPGRRQVVITFDDGYADNAHDARLILRDAGLPATFFVTAARIGEEREAWWDRLARTFHECEIAAPTLDLHVEGGRLWADLRSRRARERAHWALFWRLRPLAPARIESVLTTVETQLGVTQAHRQSHRWMNADELRQLSATPGVQIGAHSLTHPLLSTRSEEEQRNEIEESRRELQRLTGGAVRAFSYPHGSLDAFDATTVRLVRAAGYATACTATGGIAVPECDPFLIPRNAVGAWEGERFAEWLDRWMRLE